MNFNEMIDRYVNEVGEYLPRKMRADIEMELRSLLLDALEERADEEPSAKETAAFLQEFGSPETIAAQYRPAEALIGPTLFPTYKVVVTITVSIIGVLHLLLLGVTLWSGNGAAWLDMVLNSVFSFGRSAILNAGIVTIIFALLERIPVEPLALPEKNREVWDPFTLPPVKDPNRIKRAELIVGIFFGLLFLVWLNVFSGWLSGANFGEEGTGVWVLVTPEFMRLVPLFSASLLLDVGLKTAVLIQGRWNRITRTVELGTTLFGLFVAYRIFSLEQISTVPFFTTMVKIGLAVALVIGSIEMIGKLIRLLFGRPFTPRTFIKSKLA
ncbi:MAG: hypothetical protein H6654_06210 [Ardenticatenaceae bacterium]|nr:hypothetical protein [Anaerolineales bacterium]MCB8942111.1 hypothetical protein [Ardenticatenaceae bacterium]MCB8973136.1 hypothetical protein [Ardenticatenaceae bacterium]